MELPKLHIIFKIRHATKQKTTIEQKNKQFGSSKALESSSCHRVFPQHRESHTMQFCYVQTH